MIVKDEAANLPRCLGSVKDVVDEMIVLDTGSSDDTVAIARQFGAQVHHFAWNHNFADARNESLRHAQGQWILVLDADEVLVADRVPALQRAIETEHTLLINLIRQEIGAVQSPYSLVSRLFRNHPDVRFTRPYHALVDDTVAQLRQRDPQWHIVTLPEVAILHEGYQPGAIAAQSKLARAKAAMEQFFKAHPDDPYVCNKLGALYTQMGQFTEGIALLEQGLHTPDLDPGLAYELHYHLGIAYRQTHNFDSAIAHYQAALQQPILPSLKLGAYNNWGGILKEQGQLEQAKTLYEQTIQIDPTFATGHYNLGMVLKAQGDLLGAIVAYQQAIRLNPDYAEAHQNLGVVFLKMGRVAESLSAFQKAIALHQLNRPQEANRLRQALQDMGFQVTP